MTNFTFLKPNYYKEIGKLILAEGADLSVKNDENITTLDWIFLVNETETADRIRKRGAKTAEEFKAKGKWNNY